MKLKLTSDDRNAIDLLLGEAVAAATSPSTAYVAASDTDHVHAVRRVLQLMAVMPVSEPPADLVNRTLARISSTTGQALPGQISESSAINRAADGRQIRSA
jgi:hypothetical protein